MCSSCADFQHSLLCLHTKNPPERRVCDSIPAQGEFIEAPPFRGLGEKLEDIERLLADDAEALVMLRKLTTPAKGGADKNPKGLGGKSQKIDNNDNVIIVNNTLHESMDLVVNMSERIITLLLFVSIAHSNRPLSTIG